MLELDLSQVEPSLAGPRRPQDRVPLRDAKQFFLESLESFGVDYGNGHDEAVAESFPASDPPTTVDPGHGALVPGVADRGQRGRRRSSGRAPSRWRSRARSSSSSTGRS